MANIKCNYVRYRCVDGTYTHNWDICEHHDTMGGEYDELCEYADSTPRMLSWEPIRCEIPLECRHLYKENVRFEKSVKSFELDETFLTIGRTIIDTDRIEYLSIDGEEVIKEGERIK